VFLSDEEFGIPLHLPLMHEVCGVLDKFKAAIDGPGDRHRGNLNADFGNRKLKFGELIGEMVKKKSEICAVGHLLCPWGLILPPSTTPVPAISFAG